MHTKPKIYIEDITITTELAGDVGIINYMIEIAGLDETDLPVCHVNLIDANNQFATDGPHIGIQGIIEIKSPKLWWPRSMNENSSYLYTFEVI